MNDQRQAIFGQRLKILKSVNVSDILDTFLDENINNLESVRINYQKSNDKKPFLTSFKNSIGNALSDEKN